MVHDISCPLCREKYGDTNGKHQEPESAPLVKVFFAGDDCGADVERISWLVSHHHTYTDVDGMDYRILLEADFLVNAGESGYSKSAIESAKKQFFRTDAGLRLLDSYISERREYERTDDWVERSDYCKRYRYKIQCH